jgi:cyclic beta-1,2-glucan synthetase
LPILPSVSWILGLRLRGTRLYLDPYIPCTWRSFEIVFCYHSTRYDIVVENPQGVAHGGSSMALDDAAPMGDGMPIPLADDSRMHQVRIVLG